MISDHIRLWETWHQFVDLSSECSGKVSVVYNIVCDLQPPYFQFDVSDGQAVHNSYCNHKCIHNFGGGGGGGEQTPPPPSPRFSDSIHTVYDQIFLSQLYSLLTFKALARQKIISIDSRNIIKKLAAKHLPPPPPSLCTACILYIPSHGLLPAYAHLESCI